MRVRALSGCGARSKISPATLKQKSANLICTVPIVPKLWFGVLRSDPLSRLATSCARLTLLGCKWPHGCCAFQATEAFLLGSDIRPRAWNRREFLRDLDLENGEPTVAESGLGGRQIEFP
jgi:hypothetical protein